MTRRAPDAVYLELAPLERHRHLVSHLFVMKDRGQLTGPGRRIFASPYREVWVTCREEQATAWRLNEQPPRFGHRRRVRPVRGWIVGVRCLAWAPELAGDRRSAAVVLLLQDLAAAVASPAPIEGIVGALDAFVDQVLATSAATPSSPALRALAALDAASTVASVARSAGLSARTLQRQVTARIGLSPKRWMTVRRFHRALRSVALGRVSLAEVAADAGYADQAHLTGEMKRHSGTTPGRLREAELRELPPASVRFLQDAHLQRRLQLVLCPGEQEP